MLLKTLREDFQNTLKEDYPETEIQSFFKLLAECYLNLKPVEVPLNLFMSLSKEKVERFEKAIEALKNHQPIQYILGSTAFYGLPFKVSEHTLIPRPETEELVQWTIEVAQQKPERLTILDIGTGSGCIAISLAKNLPNAMVYAVDVSNNALAVAKTNARLNNVSVGFFQLDILNWQNAESKYMKFDLIVSNPPYVRELEKAQMSANVLNYEPDLALFVEDDDPLLFYRTILDYSRSRLKDHGQLFFEINQYLGADMVELLQGANFSKIVLKKDIFGNDRMITGSVIRNNS